MAQRKARSASLQKLSHDIDVRHLQIDNHDSALHEFTANPQSNVSKSADFVDILKQWTRINGKNFDFEQMRAESEINSNCKGFRTCNCIKRLIFIMHFYDEWCRKNEKKKVCKGLSINDIIEGLPHFNIIQLWNDFIHAKKCHFIQTQNNQNILETIQVWEYIESKLGVRDLDKCAKFARNNRNRTLSGTAPQRQALYFGFTQSEEIITIQFCDIIWEFFFHSKILFKNEFANKILYNPLNIEQKISPPQHNEPATVPPQRKSSRAQKRQNSITGTIGKRIMQRLDKQRSKESQVRTKPSVSDETAFVYNEDDKKQFEQYITVKNNILNSIHSQSDIADGFIKSKFVTNVYEHNNTNNRKSTLCFGVSFVYWEGYNSWHTYIKSATFANLKEEMLKNPYAKITLFQWTDTLIKAIKLNASNIGCAWKAKNAGILNKRYCIRAGLPISIAHIMTILFYINFKHLQYAFKTNGCRKSQHGESTNSVKKRNQNIGHWYKLFTECITLYGQITCKDMIFYHGLNRQIEFDAFKPDFNCMISTTSSLSVAQSIISNNAGIIIKLQQKRSLPYGFLDVHWLTDFQNESEKIFSFSKLDIVDIYQNQPTFESNTVYVKSLILFQSIMKGHYFQHTLHSDLRYQKVIICMIENWMELHENDGMDGNEEKNERDIEIPAYMQSLFNAFVNKKQQLFIIRSQYNHLYDGLRRYLIDFDQDNNYEFGVFLSAIKNRNNNRLKLLLMNEFRWEISGDTMEKFRSLAINSTIKGKYFHAGNGVVLYPRLRRSDRDFPQQSMMFCYVEDMPSDYHRISLQWELFCKQTKYHSSIQTRFLKKNEFAGYTVSDTKDLCELDSFTFQIAVQILDIDKKD